MTVVQKKDSMITARNEDTIVARNSVFFKKLTQSMPTSTNFDTPLVNPLSQEGVVATPPPFRIFPHAVFAFLLGLPFGQFSYPLYRYPCIYKKKIKIFCREKSWQQKWISFPDFNFLIFFFCHNNDHVPEILET